MRKNLDPTFDNLLSNYLQFRKRPELDTRMFTTPVASKPKKTSPLEKRNEVQEETIRNVRTFISKKRCHNK